MPKLRIAVVGANGYLGARLVSRLAADGHYVLPLTSAGGDAFDPDTGVLRDSLPDASLDGLVYLSQSPRYRSLPQEAPHVWAVNVVSAIKAAHWARRCGASRVIYASTGNVYAPSFSAHSEDGDVNRTDWYALSKRHAEEALRLVAGPEVIVARLFGVYGPDQTGKLIPNLAAKVANRQPISMQLHPTLGDDGGLHISMTHVDDVISVLRHLLINGGPPVVNIASPEVVSIRQVVGHLARLLGRPASVTVDATARQYDLIADTRRLRETYKDTFTPFEIGLSTVVPGPRPTLAAGLD